MHLCQKQENSYNKLIISTNQHPQITLYKVKKPHKIHKDLKFNSILLCLNFESVNGLTFILYMKSTRSFFSWHIAVTWVNLAARHCPLSARLGIFFFNLSINFLCYIRSLFKRLNYSKTINKNITQTVVCHTNDVTQLFFGQWQLDASFHVAALRYSRAISPRLIEFSCVTQSSEQTTNLIQVHKNSRA